MSRRPKSRTERKDTMLSVQVEIAMKRDLEEAARRMDISVSHIVRESVRQYLKKNPTEAAA